MELKKYDDRISEDASAREYSRMVSRMVRPFFLRGGDHDDLYQEGMIGLLKAIRSYDPARSDNFEAYAALCIKSCLYDAVRSDIAFSEKEKSLFERLQITAERSTEDIFSDPEALCLANESVKEIKTELSGLLSAFEASVLDPYLEGYTVREIAVMLDRPVKSVDNAVQRVRRKLAQILLRGDIRP